MTISPGDRGEQPPPRTDPPGDHATAAGLRELLDAPSQRDDDDDPSLPGYHWHSVVKARGWQQPTLDGTNGGQDPEAWLWRHQHEHQRRHWPHLGGEDPGVPRRQQ